MLSKKLEQLKLQIEQQEKIIEAIEKYILKMELEAKMRDMYGYLQNPSKVCTSTRMIENYEKQIERLFNSMKTNNEAMAKLLN